MLLHNILSLIFIFPSVIRSEYTLIPLHCPNASRATTKRLRFVQDSRPPFYFQLDGGEIKSTFSTGRLGLGEEEKLLTLVEIWEGKTY